MTNRAADELTAMTRQEIIGARLQRFTAPGSMGVVTDTTYRQCFWPALDRPTALFAEGSSGIQVQGPPTPRNVIFPAGTVFLDYGGAPTKGDCHFLAVKGRDGRYVAELTPKETDDLQRKVVTETTLRDAKEFVHQSGDGRVWDRQTAAEDTR